MSITQNRGYIKHVMIAFLMPRNALAVVIAECEFLSFMQNKCY